MKIGRCHVGKNKNKQYEYMIWFMSPEFIRGRESICTGILFDRQALCQNVNKGPVKNGSWRTTCVWDSCSSRCSYWFCLLWFSGGHFGVQGLTMICIDIDFGLEDKITAFQWACSAENMGPRANVSRASYSCSPSLSIHHPASHLTERWRDTDQQREKKAFGSETRPFWVHLNSCV